MLNDCHFKVKPGKLAEVPMGVRVFGSKYGPNLEDAIEATTSYKSKFDSAQ